MTDKPEPVELSDIERLHLSVLAAIIRGERATRKAVDDLFREARKAA